MKKNIARLRPNLKRSSGSSCRQDILRAAGRLFWQKGYLATSVDDVAKTAKITKGAMYYYFKSKAFLLYELVSKAAEAYLSIAEAVAASELPPREKLYEMVKQSVEWQTSNIGFAGIAQNEKRNLPPKLLRAFVAKRDKIEAEYRKVIIEMIEERDWQTASPKVTAMLVLGLVNSIMQWYKADGELSGEEIASEAAQFVDNALSVLGRKSHERKSREQPPKVAPFAA